MNVNKYLIGAAMTIILFAQLPLLADTSEYRAMSLYYENTSGEKCLSTYGFDKNGFIINAVWEQLDKSRTSLNFYNHDENGNLIRKYREYSDRIFSEETYEYNDKNNLIKENFYRSDGVSGTTEYEYDKNGFITITIR